MRYYEIKCHDRLELLAYRLLGDVRQWRELAELNRLDPPYIADDPTPFRASGLRVMGPGDLLAYPGDTPEPPPVSPYEADAEAYGRDLRLEGGYVVPQGGSLALVVGKENLLAALIRRLNTGIGGLPAHPDSYGTRFREYLGILGGTQETELIRLEAEATLLQDRRVEQAAVAATGAENAVRLDISVTPIDPSSG